MSQTHYVVREQARICLDVINELGPASEPFSVSFSYSKSCAPMQCIYSTVVHFQPQALY